MAKTIIHVSDGGKCKVCGRMLELGDTSCTSIAHRSIALVNDSSTVACDFNTTTLVVNDPFLRALLAECIKTLDTKGADYTAGNIETDRLHNFRTAAAETDVSMEKVWYVYFYKHISSIKRFVKDGYVESEPLRGRVIDLINYLYLLLRIEEEKTAGKK